MFGAFVGMTLFKGFFASIAGPTPSYDMPVSYTHLTLPTIYSV